MGEGESIREIYWKHFVVCLWRFGQWTALDAGWMYLLYYSDWDSDRTSVFQICNIIILAIWKDCCLWTRSNFVPDQYNLDHPIWLGNGIGKPDHRMFLVCHSGWNSIWPAVF